MDRQRKAPKDTDKWLYETQQLLDSDRNTEVNSISTTEGANLLDPSDNQMASSTMSTMPHTDVIKYSRKLAVDNYDKANPIASVVEQHKHPVSHERESVHHPVSDENLHARDRNRDVERNTKNRDITSMVNKKDMTDTQDKLSSSLFTEAGEVTREFQDEVNILCEVSFNDAGLLPFTEQTSPTTKQHDQTSDILVGTQHDCAKISQNGATIDKYLDSKCAMTILGAHANTGLLVSSEGQRMIHKSKLEFADRLDGKEKDTQQLPLYTALSIASNIKTRTRTQNDPVESNPDYSPLHADLEHSIHGRSLGHETDISSSEQDGCCNIIHDKVILHQNDVVNLGNSSCEQSVSREKHSSTKSVENYSNGIGYSIQTKPNQPSSIGVHYTGLPESLIEYNCAQPSSADADFSSATHETQNFVKPSTSQTSNDSPNMDGKHENKPYPCPECTKTYRHRESLQNHINVNHKGKRFQCDKCNKGFKSYIGLKSHKNAIHDGIYYLCSCV